MSTKTFGKVKDSRSGIVTAANIIFVATKDVFCRDKHVFVAQNYVCRDNILQTTFVATTIIRVAAPANATESNLYTPTISACTAPCRWTKLVPMKKQSKQTWCLKSTETTRFIRDEEKGVWRWGKREGDYIPIATLSPPKLPLH